MNQYCRYCCFMCCGDENWCDVHKKCMSDHILENLKKLTKLEDLEEKLGCPIEIVVKALKDGIFIKNDSCKKYQLDLYNNTNNVWVFKNKFIRNVRLKDYKQSWWLKKDKSE